MLSQNKNKDKKTKENNTWDSNVVPQRSTQYYPGPNMLNPQTLLLQLGKQS